MRPCTACGLLDGDWTPKPVAFYPCCDAELCARCAADWARRARAMTRRDGLAGGLVGLVARVLGRPA